MYIHRCVYIYTWITFVFNSKLYNIRLRIHPGGCKVKSLFPPSPGLQATQFLFPKTTASLVGQTVKNSPTMRETWVRPWVGKIPWRRAWLRTPVFVPGESPLTEEPGGLQSVGSQRVPLRVCTLLSSTAQRQPLCLKAVNTLLQGPCGFHSSCLENSRVILFSVGCLRTKEGLDAWTSHHYLRTGLVRGNMQL